MEHQALYCSGLGTFNYIKVKPRAGNTDKQRSNLSLLLLCNRQPMRIPAHIAFDLSVWEVAQLFGGGN